MMKVLLYGANGYTGKLMLDEAIQQGIQPVLGGRNESAVAALADQYKLEYRIFGLDDSEKVESQLEGIGVVCHAAGPFEFTAWPMIKACLKRGVHYLDITGEITVFEGAARYDEKARQANVMVMPGTGFDVVPTDCLALHLKERMPDATHLQLAFASVGSGPSHGTALTFAGHIGEGGVVRENGKLKRVPLGHKSQWIDFPGRKMHVMAIPWGDIATAFRSTGIPNIETYMGAKPATARQLKWQWAYNWLLRTSFVRNYIRQQIKKRPAGPDEATRLKAKSVVWGQVRNASGNILTASLRTPEGYTLTAKSSILICKKVLAGDWKPGYQTPAMAYGSDLIMEIPGVERF